MKSILLGLAGLTMATVAMADSYKCGNSDQAGKPQWFTQVSHTREAGAGRKPGFFLLTNADANGTIVSTDDRRRIVLGGAGASGTKYTVRLTKNEKRDLVKKADGRLNLENVVKAVIWVDAELNENLEDGDKVAGKLSLVDAENKIVHVARLGCTYDDASDEN